MARTSSSLLRIVMAVVGIAALMSASSCFVSAPKATPSTELRGALAGAGAAVLTSGALPAFAEKTFEVDSVEAYDLKVQYAAGLVLTASAFFVGFIISQARILVENKWLN
eukprot:TRINITY_DN29395_c0_g1_i1.p1 TRINITY_DN29395_c0_g1~~TRINITY_DN29395_c0_g1_i1.p1  ORF type:complete len:110 (-),score=19.47 TRINITY_DN29395_c0_g1_i1:148-477(-)